MTTMRKTILLGVVAVTFCTVSSAQTPSVHRVLVVSETPDSEPVVSAVKAKIGSTLRYQLGEDKGDLYIVIKCLKLGRSVIGLACSATYIYYPEALAASNAWLATNLYVGPDHAFITQGIFEDL